MADPLVIQLQTDCLNASIPISTLLRKAKLIASKLGLASTENWLDSELDGYKGALVDLPNYRKGIGQPKFFNPYHGWLDIILQDTETRDLVSTVYLSQAIAEIEHLASGKGNFVIFGFPGPVVEFMHSTLNIEYNCGLHVSKAVLVGTLEGVKNATLHWAIGLEERGILGEGLRFTMQEKERASGAQITIGSFHGSFNTGDASGPNARVIQGGVDASSNTSSADSLFQDLRTAIENGVADAEDRQRLLEAAEDMQQAPDKHSLLRAYNQLIGSAADHIGVLSPFLPALGALLAA